ncbi:helix-turn-helix domain-containing protein [Draconibacterium halophilum]|uniref:Helix-turn-helix transcriptional regulator n=1 Tax=Draconibacterium halophilum TaxID=2706887 RepID=A0A6C0R8P8_9BACT|nr:helix-turn-helix transcriptional regulator [Draconibacterium halophilum]QIA06804.1 helix-turn-helix transcriptional regulator [Draconibacterium halophilum]
MISKCKQVKYFYLIITFLSFASLKSNADRIEGKLNVDTTWNRIVYLSLISGFDQLNTMSNQMIIDRAEIDKNGKFSFMTTYLPADNRLYRLHLSKKGDPPASLIIGGKDENHIFLIANSESDIFFNCKPSETLFGNVDIKNSPESRQLTEVDKIALFFDTVSFSRSFLKRELVENALYEKLRQFADTCSFPLVALYAIYKSNFEFHVETNPDFYIRFLEKWEKERSPYFNEFRKKVYIKRNRNYYPALFGISGLLLGVLSMSFISRLLKKPSKNVLQELTIQERNIYTMLQKGKSNKEISDELSISLSTVKSHVNNIFSKLKVKSRREILNS